jgi:hypothetical protein
MTHLARIYPNGTRSSNFEPHELLEDGGAVGGD